MHCLDGTSSSNPSNVPARLYHPRPIQGDPYYEKVVSQTSQQLQRRGYRVQELKYTVRNQTQKAFLVRPEQHKPAPLWLVFGGNAMVSADWLPFCESILSFKDAGVAQPSFLLVDYPGYGDNGGEPSPSSTLEASQQALEQVLRELAESPPQSVNLLGHSLGAAAASQLAAKLARSDTYKLPPGRLVLSSPFLSIDAMAAVIFGFIPPWVLRTLVTHRWNNAEMVPKAALGGWEVSIIHPKLDEIVPVRHGEELFESIQAQGKECKLLKPEGCGHNDCVFAALRTYAQVLGLSRL
ncbi:unnamed protein product [Durusdinium trenchii]|uniref:AB hydrolase-1 domain-containing protein n=1 Tax=Durusdinium trenchii TaxID=1381693 RepID=A0ABP0KQI7_9DINO